MSQQTQNAKCYQNAQNAITIRVFGDPKAQPRPRRRNTRGQANVGIYTPTTAEGWKWAIVIAAREYQPPEQFIGPVRVDIDFYFKRPQRLCRKKDPRGRIRHIITPDRDNLDKVVLDTITNVGGFWIDDCQVCDGSLTKWWCALEGTPDELAAGATITIQELETHYG